MSDDNTRLTCIRAPPCYDLLGRVGPYIIPPYVLANGNNAGDITCCLPFVDFPLTGTGEEGDPITFVDGNNVGDVWTWDGTMWTLTPPTAVVETEFPITGNGTAFDPIDLVDGNAPNQFLAWHPGAIGPNPDEWDIFRSPVGIVDIIVGPATDRRTHFTTLNAALAATPVAETMSIRIISDIVEPGPVNLGDTFFLYLDGCASLTINGPVTSTGDVFVYGKEDGSLITFNNNITIPGSLALIQTGSVFNSPATNIGNLYAKGSGVMPMTLLQPLAANSVQIDNHVITKDVGIAGGTYGLTVNGTGGESKSTLTNVTFELSTANGIFFQDFSTTINGLFIRSTSATVNNALVNTNPDTLTNINGLVLTGPYEPANGQPATNFIVDIRSGSSIRSVIYTSPAPVATPIAMNLTGDVSELAQFNTLIDVYMPASIIPNSSLNAIIVNRVFTIGFDFVDYITGSDWVLTAAEQKFGGLTTAYVSKISAENTDFIMQGIGNNLVSTKTLNDVFCNNFFSGDTLPIDTSDCTYTNISCRGDFLIGNDIAPSNHTRLHISDIYTPGRFRMHSPTAANVTINGVRCENCDLEVSFSNHISNITCDQTVTIDGIGSSFYENISATQILIEFANNCSFDGLAVGSFNPVPQPLLRIEATDGATFSNITLTQQFQTVDSRLEIDCNDCCFTNINAGGDKPPAQRCSYSVLVSGSDNNISNMTVPGSTVPGANDPQTFVVIGNGNNFSNITLGSPQVPFGQATPDGPGINGLIIRDPAGPQPVDLSASRNSFNNLVMYPLPDTAVPATSTQVIIGYPGVDNLLNGAFNQFVNCRFFRDTAANYGVATSQPVQVLGDYNTFTQCRVGPETAPSGGGLTASTIVFDAGTTVGSAVNCMTANAVVNASNVAANIVY